MNNLNNQKELRELIREIEANLGIIDEIKSSCCGVSFAQCHSITEIGRTPNISLVDLALKLNVDNSTMSRTVNNLVNQGLVNREIDKNDRRYITISLTEKGQEIYDEINMKMNSYFGEIYENIQQDKREDVLECLRLFLAAIRKSVACGKE